MGRGSSFQTSGTARKKFRFLHFFSRARGTTKSSELPPERRSRVGWNGFISSRRQEGASPITHRNTNVAILNSMRSASEEFLAHQKCDQISFAHLPHVLLHAVLIATILRVYLAVRKGWSSHFQAVRGQMQTSVLLLILDLGIFGFD